MRIRAVFMLLPMLLGLTLLGAPTPALLTWEQAMKQAHDAVNHYHYTEAVLGYQQALKLAEAQFPVNDLRTAETLERLSDVYHMMQDKELETATTLSRAIDIYAQAYGPEDKRLIAKLIYLGEAYLYSKGKGKEADLTLTRGLSIAEKVFGPNDVHIIPSLQAIAKLRNRQHDFNAQKTILLRMLAIVEGVTPVDAVKQHAILEELVRNAGNRKKPEDEEAYLLRSISVTEQLILNGQHYGVPSEYYDRKYKTAVEQAECRTAIVWLQRKLEQAERLHKLDDEAIESIMGPMAAQYIALGNYALATECAQRVLASYIRTNQVAPSRLDS